MSVKMWKFSWMTYAKLDGDGEEIATSFLCNGVATRNTRKVDECRLDNTFLSFCGLHEAFGEA